jgi:hypothetical protein
MPVSCRTLRVACCISQVGCLSHANVASVTLNSACCNLQFICCNYMLPVAVDMLQYGSCVAYCCYCMLQLLPHIANKGGVARLTLHVVIACCNCCRTLRIKAASRGSRCMLHAASFTLTRCTSSIRARCSGRADGWRRTRTRQPAP